MWPIPLTSLTVAVRTLKLPTVRSSSRNLALEALCFVTAAFLSVSFPRRFFRQMTSAFRSVPGVFYPSSCLRSSDVLGAVLLTRLDFTTVDTFAYPRVPSRHPYSLRFGSHFIRGEAVRTLLPQVRLPRETISLKLGCITISRCCWQACTVSIDEFSHQSTS